MNNNKKSLDKEILEAASKFFSNKYDNKFRDIEKQQLNISELFYAIRGE